MLIIQIKKKFYRWCEETIELLKDALVQIEDSGQVLYGKPPDVMFSEDYAMTVSYTHLMRFFTSTLQSRLTGRDVLRATMMELTEYTSNHSCEVEVYFF